MASAPIATVAAGALALAGCASGRTIEVEPCTPVARASFVQPDWKIPAARGGMTEDEYLEIIVKPLKAEVCKREERMRVICAHQAPCRKDDCPPTSAPCQDPADNKRQ